MEMSFVVFLLFSCTVVGFYACGDGVEGDFFEDWFHSRDVGYQTLSVTVKVFLLIYCVGHRLALSPTHILSWRVIVSSALFRQRKDLVGGLEIQGWNTDTDTDTGNVVHRYSEHPLIRN